MNKYKGIKIDPPVLLNRALTFQRPRINHKSIKELIKELEEEEISSEDTDEIRNSFHSISDSSGLSKISNDLSISSLNISKLSSPKFNKFHAFINCCDASTCVRCNMSKSNITFLYLLYSDKIEKKLCLNCIRPYIESIDDCIKNKNDITLKFYAKIKSFDNEEKCMFCGDIPRSIFFPDLSLMNYACPKCINIFMKFEILPPLIDKI
jgi:hypothetical protein